MQRLLLFLCIVFSVPSAFEASTGYVELGELTFDKITSKFDVSLVKFDVAYPFGDKHEAFTAFALETKDVEDLLVADVGVKDYAEKDNEVLAKKYGAQKDNFPVVKLFIKGKEPIAFEDKEFTVDTLRKFVAEHSGLYLSLPGCVKEFDVLAAKFVQAPSDEKKAILNEADEVLKSLTDKKLSAGKIYRLIMARMIEKGNDFITTEKERVKKLISGKISPEKKKELETRQNILLSFRVLSKKMSDEL